MGHSFGELCSLPVVVEAVREGHDEPHVDWEDRDCRRHAGGRPRAEDYVCDHEKRAGHCRQEQRDPRDDELVGDLEPVLPKIL